MGVGREKERLHLISQAWRTTHYRGTRLVVHIAKIDMLPLDFSVFER